MSRILAIASAPLILAGLYASVGSYIGYTKSIEVCRHYACSIQPVFPTVSILVGGAMIVGGIIIIVLRNRLKEFIDYKKQVKTITSLFLIIGASWLHLAITQPCENFTRVRCDYSIGFPVAFIFKTDYLNVFTMLWFFIGIAINFTVWFALFSLLFYAIRMSTQCARTSEKNRSAVVAGSDSTSEGIPV